MTHPFWNPAGVKRLYALIIFAVVATAGCERGVYTRDGVTDGDTFSVPPAALHNEDPVVQSWIAYSLQRSACELENDSDNPARNSSFLCELLARETMLDVWHEYGKPLDASDDYLDLLARVTDAGLLGDYVWHYFGGPDWQPPGQLNTEIFDEWLRNELYNHEPQTRLIGSWHFD